MSTEETTPKQEIQENNTWFERFGPMHDVWIRFERGMQILLGVALITIFGFLGESWGGDNIPYPELMRGLRRVAWAFAISVMLSPSVLLLGMVARRLLPFSRDARGRAYLTILLASLGYCWFVLYTSTGELIEALIYATATI